MMISGTSTLHFGAGKKTPAQKAKAAKASQEAARKNAQEQQEKKKADALALQAQQKELEARIQQKKTEDRARTEQQKNAAMQANISRVEQSLTPYQEACSSTRDVVNQLKKKLSTAGEQFSRPSTSSARLSRSERSSLRKELISVQRQAEQALAKSNRDSEMFGESISLPFSKVAKTLESVLPEGFDSFKSPEQVPELAEELKKLNLDKEDAESFISFMKDAAKGKANWSKS